MEKLCEFCTVKRGDSRAVGMLNHIAVRENPANLRGLQNATKMALPSKMTLNALSSAMDSFTMEPQIAFAAGRLWRTGRNLPVFFMDHVSPKLRSRVMDAAQKWSVHGNIHFHVTDDIAASIIRIGNYAGEGHWSYLGTDALTIPKSQITMNLDGYSIDENVNQAELDRVVIHEFGHAIGCEHEHFHPGVDIPWDRRAVYSYYFRTQGWSRAQVDQQVLNNYSRDQFAFLTEYDENSIMHYAVPNELTLGDFEIDWNKKLSDLDKFGVSVAYPKEA